MSVSSHLSPEPERRLWIIFENLRHEIEQTDRKTAALTAFAAGEALALLSAGLLSWLAAVPLGLALPLGVAAFSPLTRAHKWLAFAESAEHDPHGTLILAEDIAGYSHNELIHKLDKYLGGGITATRYYEDIVGQILAAARVCRRKRRMLTLLCWLVGLGQAGVLLRLVTPL